MDPKQVRKLLDEVCADLDRRRAEMSAAVGRYARPVGFSLALGLGGIAGCASDNRPSPQDAYGVTVDLGDARPDLPTAEAAYGVSMDLAIDRPVDAYGITADVSTFAGADAGGIDSGGFEKPKLDAGASMDAGAADGGAID